MPENVRDERGNVNSFHFRQSSWSAWVLWAVVVFAQSLSLTRIGLVKANARSGHLPVSRGDRKWKIKTMLPPGLHFDIPEEIYRNDPGLNQSLLKDFGRARSPAHFKAAPPREETDSLRIGNYVDWATLRIKDLPNRVAVWPGERRGNDWKAFKEANKDKVILNASEHGRAIGAAKAVAIHEDAARILNVCSYQVVGIALETVGRVKALIDLLPDPTRCDHLLLAYAFDLKTSDDASPEGFALQCYKLGYDTQAAFYMDVLNLCGRNVQKFGFIVVETHPPHAVKIHYLDNESKIIRRARERYQQWAIAYLDCVKNNRWNGYAESWSEIVFKPWMLREQGYEGQELL